METIKQADIFFDKYAQRFNNALQGAEIDIEATVGAFAACFVESSPIGVMCGKNDEQFKQVIPQGYGHYKSIGITAMDILSKEISILDDYHVMAKIRWSSKYARNDNTGSIEFDVIYLLRVADGDLKIFAYITGDEQKALQERGLV